MCKRNYTKNVNIKVQCAPFPFLLTYFIVSFYCLSDKRNYDEKSKVGNLSRG